MFFTASVLSAEAEWCSITFTRGRGKWEGGHIYSEHNWYNWEDGAPDTPENDYNEPEADARGILRDSYQHIISSHIISSNTKQLAVLCNSYQHIISSNSRHQTIICNAAATMTSSFIFKLFCLPMFSFNCHRLSISKGPRNKNKNAGPRIRSESQA